MGDGVHKFPHVGGRVQLFHHFAAQGIRVRFAVMHLAAGKLPVPCQVRAVRAKREQERIIPFDDGGDDDNRRHCTTARNCAPSKMMATAVPGSATSRCT